jgi:GNAT superfamily N-acetyltransferase
MITVEKPQEGDLSAIREILTQWTEREEVEKYAERIRNEIEGETEFNMHFWVAKDNDVVLGVVGLSDPLPKEIPFTRTKYPIQLKMLYVDGEHRGKGIGKELVNFVGNKAEGLGYTEIVLRSAERYKDTAWGFYEKLGYKDVGWVTGGDDKKNLKVFRKGLVKQKKLKAN